MLFSSFLSSLLFGAIAGYVAKTKGKNPYLWFFLGVLLGIFSLLFLFLSDKIFKKSPFQKKTDTTTIDVTPDTTSGFDPEFQKTFWYYLDQQNKQNGPMSFEALTKAWKSGEVSQKTYVWNETLENWKPFEDFIQSPTN